MNTNKTISILGCGWLGFELAKSFLAKGYKVNGSTTSPDKISKLEKVGTAPFLIDLSDDVNSLNQGFFKSDILIINIPPGRRDPEVHINYPSRISKALDLAKTNGVENVILVSSTGVYASLEAHAPDWQFPIYTNNPSNAKGNSASALRSAENYMLVNYFDNGTVLRFGGLVGGDRLAGRFLAGKKDLNNGHAPVNMIHRDDCIAIINSIIEKKEWGKTYNAVADEHPRRENFYTAQAVKYKFDAPTFLNNDKAEGKIVSNRLLKKELGYSFIHPDPMAF